MHIVLMLASTSLWTFNELIKSNTFAFNAQHMLAKVFILDFGLVGNGKIGEFVANQKLPTKVRWVDLLRGDKKQKLSAKSNRMAF